MRLGLVVRDLLLFEVLGELFVHGWVVEVEGVIVIIDEGLVVFGYFSGGWLLS